MAVVPRARGLREGERREGGANAHDRRGGRAPPRHRRVRGLTEVRGVRVRMSARARRRGNGGGGACARARARGGGVRGRSDAHVGGVGGGVLAQPAAQGLVDG